MHNLELGANFYDLTYSNEIMAEAWNIILDIFMSNSLQKKDNNWVTFELLYIIYYITKEFVFVG